MQSLIKWPGGKSKEFPHIKNLIPKFERYVEPFFGGGAIFFHLQPQKALINDVIDEFADENMRNITVSREATTTNSQQSLMDGKFVAMEKRFRIMERKLKRIEDTLETLIDDIDL